MGPSDYDRRQPQCMSCSPCLAAPLGVGRQTMGRTPAIEGVRPASSSWGRRVHPQSSSRLVRSNRLLGSRPVRAQQTVDEEVVRLPTTHTITPQATLPHKSVTTGSRR
jgi:hypothetical protein